MQKTLCGKLTMRVVFIVVALAMCVAGGTYLVLPKLNASVARAQGVHQNTKIAQEVRKRTLQQPGYDLRQAVSVAAPRLGIKLDVQPGYYNAANQTWTLDSLHAFLMETRRGDLATATPVIYGHNIPAVFTRLDGVAPNEVIVITLQDGRELYFSYKGDRVVAPTDSEWLSRNVPDSIYLTTCTGSWFQSRRVMLFQFVGATAPAGQPKETR